MYVTGIHSFWHEAPTSTFGFCWGGWGMTPRLPRGSLVRLWGSESLCVFRAFARLDALDTTSLVFSLEHAFPDSESINFSVFYHLDKDESFRNNQVLLLLVNSFPLNLSLSTCVFHSSTLRLEISSVPMPSFITHKSCFLHTAGHTSAKLSASMWHGFPFLQFAGTCSHVLLGPHQHLWCLYF